MKVTNYMQNQTTNAKHTMQCIVINNEYKHHGLSASGSAVSEAHTVSHCVNFLTHLDFNQNTTQHSIDFISNLTS